jgi:hypothetical protein
VNHGDIIVITLGPTRTVACVLSCGPKTFDVVVIGGGTERHKHRTHKVRLATLADFNDDARYMERESAELRKEAADAREERRIGARMKRGQIWPSH